MAAGLIAEFQSSLSNHDVIVERTPPDSFQEILESHLSHPAVGTRIPFDSISLDTTSVSKNPTPRQLQEASTGVTGAELAIAELGSIVLQSDREGTEAVSLYSDRHIAVVSETDIVPDVDTAFSRLNAEFNAGIDDAVVATGPSATADMGSLVRGAHGPREVVVIILEES